MKNKKRMRMVKVKTIHYLGILILIPAIYWSWSCVNDYLKLRQHYQFVVKINTYNKSEDLFRTSEARKNELIYKLRLIEYKHDASPEEVLDIIKLDPENSYLQLILFEQTRDHYFDENFNITDEEVFNKKVAILNRFAALKKFDTYAAETLELLNQGVPDGYRKTLTDLVNSWNIANSYPEMSDFREVYKQKIIQSIETSSYEETEKLLYQYTKWTEALFLRMPNYYNHYRVCSFSFSILNEDKIQSYMESPLHDKSALEKLSDIWEYRYSLSKPQKTVNPGKPHKRYGSIMAARIFDLGKNDIKMDNKSLTPGREMEFAAFEKYILGAISLFFTVLAITAYTVYTFYANRIKLPVAPTLKKTDFLKVELKYLALPLTLYFLWRQTPWSSQNFSINHSAFFFLLEILILIFLVYLFSTWKIISKTACQNIIKGKIFNSWLEWVFVLVPIIGIFMWSYGSNMNHEIKDLFFVNIILDKMFITNCCQPRNWEFFLKADLALVAVYLIPAYWKGCTFLLSIKKNACTAITAATPLITANLFVAGFILSAYAFFYLNSVEMKSYKMDSLSTIEKGSSSISLESKALKKMKASYLKAYPAAKSLVEKF